jgi:hypothetical protein
MRASTASYHTPRDFQPQQGASMPPSHPPDAFTPGTAYAPPYAPPGRPARNRGPNYALYAMVILLAGGIAVYWLYPRSGILQLTIQPTGAIVAFDGRALGGHSSYLLEEHAGVHRLTVSSPGYVPFDRKVEISPRQRGQLSIALKPSPSTGFQLTSAPPGVPVWLDGRPLAIDSTGRQAKTDVNATGITPGRHVLELRGNPLFQPWREEFLQEADTLARLHADLVPVPPVTAVPSLKATSEPTVSRDHHPRPSASRTQSPEPSRALDERPAANPPRRSAASDGADEDIFENYGRR